MRLIDADSLKGLFDPGTWQGDMLIKAIDNVPTAFDVDKVVERLRAEKNMDRSKIYSSTQCDAIKHTFGMAVDIVKGAVKNG